MPRAKLSSFEVRHTHHLRAPSHLEPCRVQPVSSLYLDSSGKAQTAFWSEELEKAGDEKMRTAWRSAAAQTKDLSTFSASSVGYSTHNIDKGKCRTGLYSRPGFLVLATAAMPAVSTGGSRALEFFMLLLQCPDNGGTVTSSGHLPFLCQLQRQKEGYLLPSSPLQGHPTHTLVLLVNFRREKGCQGHPLENSPFFLDVW